MADGTPVPDPDPNGFEWRPGRVIPWSELGFKQDAAGGPGGQHANRSATRVTLTWQPFESSALRDTEKERLRKAWASRLTAEGMVQVRSAEERSAHRNRERCLEILRSLLREGLRVRRPRKKTKPTRASRERRLRSKQRHSEKKQRRRPPSLD